MNKIKEGGSPAGIVGAEGSGEDAGDGGAAPETEEDAGGGEERRRRGLGPRRLVEERSSIARRARAEERRRRAAWWRRRGLSRCLGAERPDGDVEVRQPGGVVVFGAVGGN
jgi:hypothetical protein